MLTYDGSKKDELFEACVSLAYKVAHYEHPTWYEIPDEEVARILREEGLGILEVGGEY